MNDEKYVHREIKRIFEKLINHYNIIALVGARQSGKTTFLKREMKSFNSSYILFDDPDARDIFNEDIKKFKDQYLKGFDVVILDEIQNCDNPGQKLKYLADTGERLWITSSSEIILSKEVFSYLVGRVAILKLYPFSIKEFLNSKKQRVINEKILERMVWEHITYGGYPKVVTTDDIEVKKVILKNIYDTMILKDIARVWSIEDLKPLEKLVRYLSINTGSVLSYQNVSNKINVSFQTVKKYLAALEKSYLIIRVNPFYTNKTNEIVKQSKIYFLDTGLRNIIAKQFDIELNGLLFENYVLSELIKLNKDVKFWRTKNHQEVDFVVEEGKKITAIEVKLQSKNNKLSRSLHSFIKKYHPNKVIVVFYKGNKDKKKINNTNVIFTDILGMINEMNKMK
ncbi:ATP-binding protein [Candidatus Micrarchaeota archaeon]|nr:ATP-binding protein [Candidatus Micrarchaeota archaeon]